MSLDPQVKADWLTALRSGEYKQGRGQLCDAAERFCCLGVLADVSYDGEWEFDDTNGLWGVVASDSSEFVRLVVFGEEVGLSEEEEGVLSRMNDAGKSFAEIANYIEAYL